MNVLLRNKISAMAVALLAIASTMSCSVNGHYGNGDDNFFSAFNSFSNTRWSYEEPLEFVVDTLATESCSSGDLLLTLRHTHGYEYSNIWLELCYDLSDSTVHKDTLNIVLADVYGHWRGSGPGNTFCVTDTVLHNVPLHRHQRIGLRHIMRIDTLQNIEQIGITYLPHK